MPTPVDIDQSQQSVYRRIWDELCNRRSSSYGTTPRPPQRVEATKGKKKCVACNTTIAVGEQYIAIVDWRNNLLAAICSNEHLEELLSFGSLRALRLSRTSSRVAAEREGRKARDEARVLRIAKKMSGYCATCGGKVLFDDGRTYQCIKCRNRHVELAGVGSQRYCRRCGERFTVETVQQRICKSCRT